MVGYKETRSATIITYCASRIKTFWKLERKSRRKNNVKWNLSGQSAVHQCDHNGQGVSAKASKRLPKRKPLFFWYQNWQRLIRKSNTASFALIVIEALSQATHFICYRIFISELTKPSTTITSRSVDPITWVVCSGRRIHFNQSLLLLKLLQGRSHQIKRCKQSNYKQKERERKRKDWKVSEQVNVWDQMSPSRWSSAKT